jgi:hypothetical protein
MPGEGRCQFALLKARSFGQYWLLCSLAESRLVLCSEVSESESWLDPSMFFCSFSPFSSACEFAVNGTLSRLFLFTLQSIARRLTHLIHDATH